MKKSQEKMPYLNDGELYILWKYINSLKQSYLLLNDQTSHKKQLFPWENFANARYASLKEKNKLDDYELRSLNFLEDLVVKNIDLSDLPPLLSESEARGIIMCFDEILLKDPKHLETLVDSYIENFINDNLSKDRVNFYCFTKQKEKLIKSLYFHEDSYGRDFIIEYPTISDFNPRLDNEYLFIHTLVVLEKLNYITIEEIWTTDWDLPYEKQMDCYRARITIQDKLIKEKNRIAKEISIPDKKISSLIIANAKKTSDYPLLIVNEDYKNPIKIDMDKAYLKHIYNAIIGGFTSYDKSSFDFVNSKRSLIQKGFKKSTKIFERKAEISMMIADNIEHYQISEKAFQERLGKLKKA